MTDRQTFEAARGFPLDEFQQDALDALDAGRSVLVAAPTGSGKTLVAEYAVERALAHGRKVFYTTPLKALSNQKFSDLARMHGRDRVGLLTGDSSVNGEAPVVVMTTEVLRNMIYAGSRTLEDLEYVVLDEVHYLQDRYRGAVWEEVIIHLAPEVDLVCLSATVSNAEEVAAWIETVRGATTAVIEEKRPVVLHHRYLDYGAWAGPLGGRKRGTLVSMEAGVAVAFALFNLSERATLFVAPGTPVYEGMIVGENSRPGDLDVNPTKEKKLTNMRTTASDENIQLEPPRELTLEGALEYIEDDELIEVTPQSIRLRKRYLSASDRKKLSREAKRERIQAS